MMIADYHLNAAYLRTTGDLLLMAIAFLLYGSVGKHSVPPSGEVWWTTYCRGVMWFVACPVVMSYRPITFRAFLLQVSYVAENSRFGLDGVSATSAV